MCVGKHNLSDNDNITLYIKNNRQRRMCNKSEGEEGELHIHTNKGKEGGKLDKSFCAIRKC